MNKSKTRSVVQVFIASPGDLTPERQATRREVDELNRTLGREFDVHVDLIGWEDTLPGGGRPQELINADVDACDLFLGLLWARWGQPTGEYSSGFEEEFSRAIERRKHTGCPQMWLAFKRVDEGRLADPGAQLERVLAFKEQQKDERLLLFKEFSTTDEWSRMVREWLSIHVARTAKANWNSESNATASPSKVTLETIAPVASPELLASSSAVPQLMPILKHFEGLIAVQSEASLQEAVRGIARWDAIRLQLFSKAVLSQTVTAENMSLHDVHVLYQHREGLSFLFPERDLLLRTLVSDRADVVPGWYWFQAWPDATVEATLFEQAGVSNKDLQIGALSLLTLGRYAASTEEAVAVVSEALTSDDSIIVANACEYVVAVGNAAWLDLLSAAQRQASGVSEDVIKSAKITLLQSYDLEGAVKMALDESVDFRSASAVHMSHVTIETLRAAVQRGRPNLRRAAAAALLAKNELSDQDAEALLHDPSLVLREFAYRHFIRRGRAFDPDEIRQRLTQKASDELKSSMMQALLGSGSEVGDADGVLEEFFSAQDIKDLENKIDWFSISGPSAYLALARRSFSDQIRRDLDEGFVRIRHKSIERITAQHGELASSIIVDRFKDLEEYLQSRYYRAAMLALAEHARSEDRERALAYLANEKQSRRDEDGTKAALEILRQFGLPSDVDFLLALANTTYGAMHRKIASIAYALSPGASGIVTKLLGSNRVEAIRAGLFGLSGLSHADVSGLVQPLLNSDNPEVRLCAVATMIAVSDDSELGEVLKQYINQDSYYYTVVAWLDRCLFASPRLKAAFRSTLAQKLLQED